MIEKLRRQADLLAAQRERVTNAQRWLTTDRATRNGDDQKHYSKGNTTSSNRAIACSEANAATGGMGGSMARARSKSTMSSEASSNNADYQPIYCNCR